MIPQLCWSGIQRAEVRNRWKFKSTTQMERWLRRRRKWSDLVNTRIKSAANLRSSLLLLLQSGFLLVFWWQRLSHIIHVCFTFSDQEMYPIYFMQGLLYQIPGAENTNLLRIRYHFWLFVASRKKRPTLTIPKQFQRCRKVKVFDMLAKCGTNCQSPKAELLTNI